MRHVKYFMRSMRLNAYRQGESCWQQKQQGGRGGQIVNGIGSHAEMSTTCPGLLVGIQHQLGFHTEFPGFSKVILTCFTLRNTRDQCTLPIMQCFLPCSCDISVRIGGQMTSNPEAVLSFLPLSEVGGISPGLTITCRVIWWRSWKWLRIVAVGCSLLLSMLRCFVGDAKSWRFKKGKLQRLYPLVI